MQFGHSSLKMYRGFLKMERFDFLLKHFEMPVPGHHGVFFQLLSVQFVVRRLFYPRRKIF